jgi:hypothetical protein
LHSPRHSHGRRWVACYFVGYWDLVSGYMYPEASVDFREGARMADEDVRRHLVAEMDAPEHVVEGHRWSGAGEVESWRTRCKPRLTCEVVRNLNREAVKGGVNSRLELGSCGYSHAGKEAFLESADVFEAVH